MSDNKYCRWVKQQFSGVPIKHAPVVNHKILSFHPKQVDERLLNWLKQFGMNVGTDQKNSKVRLFNTYPNMAYNLHVDVVNSECVNFNILANSYNSTMAWYKLLPGKTGTEYVDPRGSSILGFDIQNCEEVFRSTVDQPVIVNAAEIHNLITGDNRGVPRQCYSMRLYDIETGKPMKWDETMVRFGDDLTDQEAS